MKLFYIPDGHRRFAIQSGITLEQAYERGYHVLRDEIIRPLCQSSTVTRLCVFLLSQLNMRRRDSNDLAILLEAINLMLPKLCEECAEFASVRLFGKGRVAALESVREGWPKLDLFIGCDTDDDFVDGEVDIFLRSGGSIRLSGAPRKLVGPYTEMYSLKKLHPELAWTDIKSILRRYECRYLAEKVSSSVEGNGSSASGG